MKQAQTALGPIDPADLGITLMHEHLWDDISCWLEPPRTPAQAAVAAQPITLANLGLFRREPLLSQDNLILNDLDMIIEEAAAFRRGGGGTIVEVTLPGIGQDVVKLQQIARAVGLNVVCGCGYYVGSSHPPQVARMTKQEIAGEMICRLTAGIEETGVRAGIIGEIGLSPGILPDEEKTLRAAVWAARETGAAITIHPPWPRGEKHRVLDILEAEGADLTRVILDHVDFELDSDLHQSLADRGVYLEYDTFGQEYCRDAYAMHDPLDTERVAVVAEMVQRGYATQILLSQDVCTKMDTCRYGGWGYAHISEHIEPMLRTAGVTEAQIHTMRVENPRRLLPF